MRDLLGDLIEAMWDTLNRLEFVKDSRMADTCAFNFKSEDRMCILYQILEGPLPSRDKYIRKIAPRVKLFRLMQALSMAWIHSNVIEAQAVYDYSALYEDVSSGWVKLVDGKMQSNAQQKCAFLNWWKSHLGSKGQHTPSLRLYDY